MKPNSTAAAPPLPIAWLIFDVLCAAGANALLLWFFHDRFWYAPDEGNYAHVAQRLLNGEVLNLQIQDIHPGYINFVNAAAFRVFGLDLLSLRYPLVLLAFTQAMLIFILFYRSGRRRLAAVAAVTINALGVVNFLNPTSNWYSLFLIVLIACAIIWIPRDSGIRLVVVGFLVGMLVLFRQVSGVLACMGVVTCLLLEVQSADRTRRPIAARVLIAIMATGLAWYLAKNTDVTGFVLFGFCPLLLLGWLFMKTTAENSKVVRIVGQLASGGIIAALPLVLYHVIHGSLQAWLNDTVVSAIGLTKLPFMGLQLYGKLVVTGVSALFHMHRFAELPNGLYWIALPLLAFVHGVVLLRFLTRNRTANPIAYTFPVLAIFYAIVSVHFQIPIYLYYTAGLTMVGLLWLVSINKSRIQYVVVVAAILLSFVSVYYHAGQPLPGSFADFFSGSRNISRLTNSESSITRATLKIDADERQRYSAILKVIEAETTPNDSIFALPTNAELYFLSGRRNPFRFYNTALGIRTPEQLDQVKQTIINSPPKIVIHHAADKYNTPYSQELVRLVSERYDFLGETSGFAVYRSRQSPDRPPEVSLR
ncbi:MAG TPA: hypothetical protein VFR51_04100 [Pyrinomonadaceae bacterium]|nr:hypothetical protein [Pyrinomonadaceae bacterium]